MALAPTHAPVETPSHAFYRDVLELLTRSGVPFLIGGAVASAALKYFATPTP